MVGWLLLQDLAVIPMMILIYALGKGSGNILLSIGASLGKAMLAIVLVVILGRIVVPKILHKVSLLNSRELLVLTAVIFAIGTALFTSFLGISPALGAFLAGVVISESQENLAVFAETRPLRDLFVAVFFVSLGFLVNPLAIWQNLLLIVGLSLFVICLKFVVGTVISIVFRYHGKTAISVGVGLSQIGEFSFVLLSLAKVLNLISDTAATIGIATTLLSLIIFPLIYKNVLFYWRKIKKVTVGLPFLNKLLLGWDKKTLSLQDELKDHVIICGYGRVGSWVGKALESLEISYVVVEYNRNLVDELKQKGIRVIYGDPSEQEVLEAADITDAKAIIVAIPDRAVQEMVVTLSQTLAPQVKIITRVHTDDDWEKMKYLRVTKIIQPEFEAAVAIVRSMLSSMGKSKEEITERIKNLRLSRAQY
jgi:CPA2 family monovalent cation:H+ antiporter-2